VRIVPRRAGHREYATDVGPRLNAHIHRHRDAAFEAALQDGFMLYSFTFEDFLGRAEQNQDAYGHLAMILVSTQDAFRGLIGGHINLSAMTVAVLTRVILELRCHLTFITTRSEPTVWAERFARFGRFQKLVHDQRLPPEERRLTAEERAQLSTDCAEWICPTNKGSRFANNWWEWEPTLRRKSLRFIASESGLSNEYQKVYSSTSLFVHGSPRIRTSYEDANGNVAAIAIPAKLKPITHLGAAYAMSTLRTACDFFGVVFDRAEEIGWRERMMAANTSASGTSGPAPAR
jgi:hypothetical protein